MTNVSFHNPDRYGIVSYVRCTGRPVFAKSAQPHSTDNTPHNQLKHRSTITARFANPATACQNAVRCYAARAGASFRLSAAQHPHGPSILLGPLSLVGCKSLRSGGWCWAACCWSIVPTAFCVIQSLYGRRRHARVESHGSLPRCLLASGSRLLVPDSCNTSSADARSGML